MDPALIFLEDKGLWPLSLTLLEQEGTARLYYGILDMVPVVLLLGVVMVVMRKRSMK